MRGRGAWTFSNFVDSCAYLIFLGGGGGGWKGEEWGRIYWLCGLSHVQKINLLFPTHLKFSHSFWLLRELQQLLMKVGLGDIFLFAASFIIIMRTVNTECISKEKSYYISILTSLLKLLRKIGKHHLQEGGIKPLKDVQEGE